MTTLELQSLTALFCDLLTETGNGLKINQGNSLAQAHIITLLNDAIEAYRKAINSDAIAQGEAILAADGRTSGEFTHEMLTTGNLTTTASFQIQATPEFDLDDYRRYKSKEAVAWREAKEKRDDFRLQASAQTAVMAAQLEAFITKNKTKRPDNVRKTLKCLRKND